jgi:fatty-acid desaturase
MFAFNKDSRIHVAVNHWISIIAMFSIPVFVWQFNAYQLMACAVGYFLWHNIGISAGYHRLATHRQYSPPIWFKYWTMICGVMTAQGPAISWAAQHTAHHAYTDTENDPHSPVHKGFWNSFFNLHYLTKEVKPIHGRRVIGDDVYLWQMNNYWLIMILTLLLFTMIDPFSLIYFWLVPCGLTRLTESYIVAINHRKGYAVNNYPLGIISGGEGWHKTHHERANALVLHKHDWFGKILKKYLNN